jgi:acyl-CoA synthetase (AMP-forming)/AMP-acid ligase II
VVPAAGATLEARALLGYCRGSLEAYKVPEQVRIVDDLPRSSLGKVKKDALRALATGELGNG